MGALRVLGLSAAITLAAPLAAEAATVTLDGALLSVNAAAGEANRITIAEDAAGFTVTDTRALTAGSGCTSVNATMARCATSETTRSALVEAGDGDDRVVLRSPTGTTSGNLRGGDGRDRLFGGNGADALIGGEGADTLTGGEGNNFFDGGPGDDNLYGGDDVDLVSYQSRTRTVRVDLKEHKGGQRGEGDLLDDIEQIVGGRGADKLRGTKTADMLLGGPGRAHDDVRGRGGGDFLVGRRVIGGGGSDRIDGQAMDCGGGRDTILRKKYRPRGPFHKSCEKVVAKFVVLGTRPSKSSRAAAVFKVRCRSRGCGGRLEVRDSRGRLGKQKFSGSGRVRVKFARRPAQAVVTLRIRNAQRKQRSVLRTPVR
jgi:hypothetical protein